MKDSIDTDIADDITGKVSKNVQRIQVLDFGIEGLDTGVAQGISL